MSWGRDLYAARVALYLYKQIVYRQPTQMDHPSKRFKCQLKATQRRHYKIPSEPLLSFSEEIEAKLAFKNLLCGKPAARLQILQEQRRRREEPLMRKAPREPAKPKKKALPHANGNEEESPTSVKLKIREGKLTIWKGSPRVEFCGYSIPHPSENKVNIRVQTTGDSAKDVLKESFQDLILLCQHVRSTFEKSVADFKSTQSDFKSTQSHQEMNGA